MEAAYSYNNQYRHTQILHKITLHLHYTDQPVNNVHNYNDCL